MKLIDNVNTRLGDDLKESIRKGSKLCIAASSFSIYAYEALKKEFEKIEELRFIFTSPTFLEENFRKDARKEVLNSLLALNLKFHAEEVAAGLWDKKSKKGKGYNVSEDDDVNRVEEDDSSLGGLFSQ